MTASSPRSPLWFVFLLVLANLLWGTTFAVNKYVLSGSIGPPSLAFVRHLMAGLIVLAGVLWWRIPFPRGRDFLWACLLGLLAHAGAVPIEYLGTQHTTASNVALLIATEAALCVIFASLLLGEHFSGRKILGVCLSLGGAGLILWKDIRQATVFSLETVQGDLLVLGATVLYALYTIAAKGVVRRCNPSSVFAVASLFASFLLSVWAGPELIEHPPWTYSLELWWWIFYLAVPCLAIPVVMWYSILRHVSAGAVGSSLFLQPLFGVACATVFLGERIGALFVSAGCVILLGLCVTVAADRAKSTALRDATPDIENEADRETLDC